MKANHNNKYLIQIFDGVVSNIKNSKNESKSQPMIGYDDNKPQLYQISRIQRMKANHNINITDPEVGEVVSNIKNSKNESKSQQIITDRRNKTVVSNIKNSKNESKSQPIRCSFF